MPIGRKSSDFLFIQGLSESTLLEYLEEMEEDFEKSRPFQLIKKAKAKYDFPLYKPGDLFFLFF